MRQYIRSDPAGATCFFTVVLQERGSRWLTDHAPLLRDAFRKARARYPFAIDAIVVLPDHLHAVWTLPEGDADFSARWRMIKRGFTRRLAQASLLKDSAAEKRGGGERSLWQRSFWEHQIRDGDDFAKHVDYIHFNPVKHGFVARAVDWPYSSIHRYVRQGVIGADWGLESEEEGRFGE
jgi:putative transposase